MKIQWRASLKKIVFASLLLIGSANIPFTADAVAVTPAPAFSAVALDGRTVNSSQLAGRAYIVNFFASWCPPCRAELPDMVVLQRKYARKGFTFIGIAVNETDQTMRSFIRRYKINYPVLMVDDKLMATFSDLVDGGINGIPTSFVVNADGQVTEVFTGGKSRAEFERVIVGALTKRSSKQPRQRGSGK